MHENKNSDSTHKFDSIYINPGFEEFPKILEEQKNRIKTMVVFETDLERTDNFQLTRLFPFHFYELPGKIKEYKIWQSAFKIAPHLLQSQKVFYPGISKLSKYTAKIADFNFNNSFQKKHKWIPDEQKNHLPFIKTNYQRGVYFQEYKFNYSRFFVEILKYFKDSGGVVEINKKANVKGKLLYLNSNKKYTANKITVQKISSNRIFKIPIETPPGFLMAVKQNQHIIYFLESDKKLILNGNENISETKLLNVGKKYVNIDPNKIETGIIPTNIKTQTLLQITSQIENSLTSIFEKVNFESLYELCLEKYDIAKQTGISYADFKILFHRYGKGIDEITENAYQQMNQIRDSKIIWTSVEEMFQKKYEWKI